MTMPTGKGGGDTVRDEAKGMVARMLGVELESVTDETDISSLDPVRLMKNCILHLGVSYGGRGGYPKTFGEVMEKLEEVRRTTLQPGIQITVKF